MRQGTGAAWQHTTKPASSSSLLPQASLAEVNQHLASKGEAALPINRFRPNLVVRGAGAFAEDGWGSLRIGAAGGAPGDGVEFDNVKPCSRCKVRGAAVACARCAGRGMPAWALVLLLARLVLPGPRP